MRSGFETTGYAVRDGLCRYCRDDIWNLDSSTDRYCALLSCSWIRIIFPRPCKPPHPKGSERDIAHRVGSLETEIIDEEAQPLCKGRGGKLPRRGSLGCSCLGTNDLGEGFREAIPPDRFQVESRMNFLADSKVRRGEEATVRRRTKRKIWTDMSRCFGMLSCARTPRNLLDGSWEKVAG
jgi:hypothetical protein